MRSSAATAIPADSMTLAISGIRVSAWPRLIGGAEQARGQRGGVDAARSEPDVGGDLDDTPDKVM